ncbi:hypothetical protein NMG60_11022200 [Bertholletia excelsa]
MAQKVVLKVMTMTDEKTKQKAIEAAADIHGVDSIAADLKDQKLTLKKVGKVDIITIGRRRRRRRKKRRGREERRKEGRSPKEEKKEAPKEEKK